MRLIDADTWKPWYNEVKINLEVYNQYADGYEDAIDNVDDWMDAQTTIDAVPVVRCKDCKDYAPIEQDLILSEAHQKAGMCNRKMLGLIAEDGFCSYGERKDDG